MVVVGGLGGVRAALAEAEATHVDDFPVYSKNFFIREMKARHRLRPDVVDQDVSALRDREAGLERGGVFEVERDRALVAVGVEEDVPMPGLRNGQA
jgi:hypothetical protein